jgi:hypothetical protein
MRRSLALAIATTVAITTATLPAIAPAAPPVKRHLPHWHGYGFLPGYHSPEQLEWERMHAYRNWYGAPVYWYGGPGFYHGRWNGGGFGPCWTPTPIGPHWNCG